jgi:hypothetical protein
MHPSVLPVLPLFPCTASLYSLALITPYYSVANRRVAWVASYWLANSVWPVPTCPVKLSRQVIPVLVWYSRAVQRAGVWLVHAACAPRSDRSDLLVFQLGSVAGVVWDRGTTWDREKGYMLLNNCTHNRITIQIRKLKFIQNVTN